MTDDDTPDFTSPRVALTPQEPPTWSFRDQIALEAFKLLLGCDLHSRNPMGPRKIAQDVWLLADEVIALRTKEPRA